MEWKTPFRPADCDNIGRLGRTEGHEDVRPQAGKAGRSCRKVPVLKVEKDGILLYDGGSITSSLESFAVQQNKVWV